MYLGKIYAAENGRKMLAESQKHSHHHW